MIVENLRHACNNVGGVFIMTCFFVKAPTSLTTYDNTTTTTPPKTKQWFWSHMLEASLIDMQHQ